MNVHAFIDLEESTQIAEIRSYLSSKGVNISEENVEGGLGPNLLQVIEASAVAWKLKDGIPVSELEMVYNGMISLLHVIPHDQDMKLIEAFCSAVATTTPSDKHKIVKLRLLTNLFSGFDERSSVRYVLYKHIIALAGGAGAIHIINPELDEIKRWVQQWEVSTEMVQDLLRTLHEAFQRCKKSEQATKTMIELLGTYTDETASKARDDAQKCIVTCLGDPHTYILDHLLTLKPVRILEGEPIHDLLMIFICGKLAKYVTFHEVNKEWVKSIGLIHEENMHKMRLLSFMQMAEDRLEIDFVTIQNELLLKPNEVESFIIDVVRTKAVRVKIDQTGSRVIISSTTHRTFGEPQWHLLRDRLASWQHNMTSVITSLQSVLHTKAT